MWHEQVGTQPQVPREAGRAASSAAGWGEWSCPTGRLAVLENRAAFGWGFVVRRGGRRGDTVGDAMGGYGRRCCGGQDGGMLWGTPWGASWGTPVRSAVPPRALPVPLRATTEACLPPALVTLRCTLGSRCPSHELMCHHFAACFCLTRDRMRTVGR